jgi:signal transduction histidine kinase
MRTASLRKQKEILAEKVNERTRDLKEKNLLLEKANATLQEDKEIIKSQTEELKATAENLEKTNKELASINDTKDKLFSIIGHDLRNPFNVILGYTDLLLSNYDEWETGQIREIIEQIDKSSKSAFHLLDNLLHWSRSQQGTLEYAPSPTGVSEAIETVTLEVTPFSEKKGIAIIPLLEDKKAKVNADVNMLTLILRNLLMNAVKFSNRGGEIFIRAESSNHRYIRFSIQDQGIGMDEKTCENLFKLNKKPGATGTEGEKGTGLGLILCKEFVTRHGGTLWVTSKKKEGTTFFFTIPQA